MKKYFAIVFGLMLALNLAIPLVFAQDIPPIIPPVVGKNDQVYLPQGDTKGNPADYVYSTLLPQITNTVIGLTGGLSLLFVVVSGIQILIAYGNEEKIGAAKKTLTWALVGLVIAILSYAIVQIVVSINIGHRDIAPASNQQGQQQPAGSGN